MTRGDVQARWRMDREVLTDVGQDLTSDTLSIPNFTATRPNEFRAQRRKVKSHSGSFRNREKCPEKKAARGKAKRDTTTQISTGSARGRNRKAEKEKKKECQRAEGGGGGSRVTAARALTPFHLKREEKPCVYVCERVHAGGGSLLNITL